MPGTLPKKSSLQVGQTRVSSLPAQARHRRWPCCHCTRYGGRQHLLHAGGALRAGVEQRQPQGGAEGGATLSAECQGGRVQVVEELVEAPGHLLASETVAGPGAIWRRLLARRQLAHLAAHRVRQGPPLPLVDEKTNTRTP